MGNNIKQYNKYEVVSLLHTEKITADDFTYLTALQTYGAVSDEGLTGFKCVDIKVAAVDEYPTGFFFEQGKELLLVINEEKSILDYDFISRLHPIEDADIYLWLSHKWADVGSDLGIHGEWYRRDVYPDGIRPFQDKLGWEDLTPQMGE